MHFHHLFDLGNSRPNYTKCEFFAKKVLEEFFTNILELLEQLKLPLDLKECPATITDLEVIQGLKISQRKILLHI